MSIQGVGALCGNLLSGQIADLFGRKRPFFAAVLLTIIANFVSFLANSWTLIAVTRFFVGLSASAFMTVKYALLSEFTLAQYRAWIIGFPSWAIEASIFVGVAWVLQGWRYIQLLNAIIGLPCLLAWW